MVEKSPIHQKSERSKWIHTDKVEIGRNGNFTLTNTHAGRID